MGWLSKVEVVLNFDGRDLAKVGRSKMWMCVFALTPLSECGRRPPKRLVSEKHRPGGDPYGVAVIGS